MKIIQAFQASDGTVFSADQRKEAEEHELKIKFKGIIQSHVRGTAFTPAEIADIICKNAESVMEVLANFKKTMKKLEKIAG